MKKLILLPLIVFAIQVFAQDSDPIVTDRPTQSAAASVMPKGKLLIEAGFVAEKTTPNITNTTFGNFHFRYGIVDGIEIRLTQNFVGIRNDLTDFEVNGLSPLTLGAKIHLFDEDGMIPQASVIGQMTFRNGESDFRPAGRGFPEVRFNFANSLTKEFSLGYNIGMSFAQDDINLFYTVVLGYSFADKWTLFVEPYGGFANSNVNQFNTGLIYLFENNIQFDISTGLGLSNTAPDSFIGFGAAIGF